MAETTDVVPLAFVVTRGTRWTRKDGHGRGDFISPNSALWPPLSRGRKGGWLEFGSSGTDLSIVWSRKLLLLFLFLFLPSISGTLASLSGGLTGSTQNPYQRTLCEPDKPLPVLSTLGDFEFSLFPLSSVQYHIHCLFPLLPSSRSGPWAPVAT